MVDALFEGVRDAIVAEGHERLAKMFLALNFQEEYWHLLPIPTFEIMQFGIRISDNQKMLTIESCVHPITKFWPFSKKIPSPWVPVYAPRRTARIIHNLK